jgi:hypothetical protein
MVKPTYFCACCGKNCSGLQLKQRFIIHKWRAEVTVFGSLFGPRGNWEFPQDIEELPRLRLGWRSLACRETWQNLFSVQALCRNLGDMWGRSRFKDNQGHKKVSWKTKNLATRDEIISYRDSIGNQMFLDPVHTDFWTFPMNMFILMATLLGWTQKSGANFSPALLTWPEPLKDWGLGKSPSPKNEEEDGDGSLLLFSPRLPRQYCARTL